MTTSATSRNTPPVFIPDEIQHRRLIGQWIREANQGHLANTGTVTLLANVTSTTVEDARAGANSFIGFMPITANAASAQAVGNVYVSTRAKQKFVIAHPSSASVDQNFVYCVLG